MVQPIQKAKEHTESFSLLRTKPSVNMRSARWKTWTDESKQNETRNHIYSTWLDNMWGYQNHNLHHPNLQEKEEK